ncbi:prolyl aminopeptidase [Paraliomyxa miuraensis]|uniref:prolyl aminopeptidase n=1 Tax=Paraliomyxa miuraensis TaxID=376150 RepID=UPI00225406B8|nr:prolyl aminopeptidase [Paraliomyxa miuraensis]MCX4247267.1 prolyl aminopeptidase [Paraliomyxa miuraensis]
MSGARSLYPEIEPYDSGKLRVSELHELYYEQCGNPDGKPVVFLHGGPGGGIEPRHRRFFDPEAYRIVLFDQRGCGRSTPYASLVDNTTWHLVDDIEALREHLGIERWQVFGGSWGSTLALAYAQRHRERVTEMVLRGIFTFAPDEGAWFYGGGTTALFPDAWEGFVHAIPEAERDDLVGAYYRRLTGDDPGVRRAAARAWSEWECRVATLLPDEGLVAHCEDASFTLAFARIECHYFVNEGFFDPPTQLLDGMEALLGIPVVIVHGRYDVICPPRNAWRLHRAWPGSQLCLVEDAGHSANEPGITAALVAATDRFRG